MAAPSSREHRRAVPTLHSVVEALARLERGDLEEIAVEHWWNARLCVHAADQHATDELMADRNLVGDEHLRLAELLAPSAVRWRSWDELPGDDAPMPTVCRSAVADGHLNRASDTTRLVDRLERAGLAERLPHPADRRSMLVRATAEGRRVYAAVTPKLQRFHPSAVVQPLHRRAHHAPAPPGQGPVGPRRLMIPRMSMQREIELADLGIEVPDPSSRTAFFGDVIGLAPASSPTGWASAT
jgi:hypothetical protein